MRATYGWHQARIVRGLTIVSQQQIMPLWHVERAPIGRGGGVRLSQEISVDPHLAAFEAQVFPRKPDDPLDDTTAKLARVDHDHGAPAMTMVPSGSDGPHQLPPTQARRHQIQLDAGQPQRQQWDQ